ncbi:MAG TPA: hypothetical protein VI300_12885, partial [Solirubrobacter sp.]
MFTPVPAVGDRLLPWCVLAVVEKGPGVTLAVGAGAPLPVLTIAPPAVAHVELPDLADSWAWAHGQLLQEAGAPPGDLDADPQRNLSRLVCPRRLKPETRYLACVVPAFAVGVARGLGLPVTATELLPAWDADVAGISLPVYHFWEFATAVEDDVESMARRLHGPEHLPPSLGRRDVYAAAGHPDLAAPALPAAARTVTMHGALRAVEAGAEAPQAPELTTRLAGIVNRRTGPELPAPLYGEWAAEQHTVPDAQGWLRELNTSVGARVAAGLGAEVVRRHQEDFVQAAWEQAGAADEANRLANRARLAAAVLDRLVTRHVTPRAADRLLQVTAPMHAATRVAPGLATIAVTLDGASVPGGATSAAYRRLASGRRQALRRAVRRAGLVRGPGVIALTAAPPSAAAVEPLATMPDGVTRLRTALVAGAAGPVALSPLGLPGSTTAAEVAKLAPVPPAVNLPTTARPFFPPTELAPVISQLTGRAAKPVPNAIPILRPPRASTDVVAVKTYNAALARMVKTVNAVPPQAAFATVDPAALGGRVSARIEPFGAVVKRVRAMVTGFGADAFDPFAGVKPFPMLPAATFGYLDALPGSWVLPEASGLEADTAILLRTNREFVTAFLAGLNHEMNRELLWRGYPTDQRGTPFQHFWDRVDGQVDITPVHRWNAADPLAAAGAPTAAIGEQVVLLLRGRLLRRYPDMVIYATKGTRSVSGTTIPPEGTPIFFARLAPDLNLAGFPLTPQQLAADEWWFVLEQQLAAPRFGFDSEAGPPAPATSWADERWSALHVAPGQHIRLRVEPFATGRRGGQLFGTTADTIATSMLQRPVRVALHRDRLLAPPGTG